MDYFTICPQDHKNLIYSYLGLSELIRIGLVSRLFYSDKKRRAFMARQLVDDVMYITIHEQPVLLNLNFRLTEYYTEIRYIYFDSLSKIKFTDIEHTSDSMITITPCSAWTQNSKPYYGRTINKTFEYQDYLCDYGVIVPFAFFVDAFITLSNAKKIDIIHNIASYMMDLWRYAEKSKKCIYNTRLLFKDNTQIASESFEFSQLFLSMHNIFKEIFVNDPDYAIKRAVFDIIHRMGETTHESTYCYFVLEDEMQEMAPGQGTFMESGGLIEGGEAECRYYANDYDLTHFVKNLQIHITEIEKIVEIGNVIYQFIGTFKNMKNYSYSFLVATFIAEIFDEFLMHDYRKDLDCYSELILEKLNEPSTTDPEHSNDRCLSDLFTFSNFDYNQFKYALKIRSDRWLS